MHGEPSSYRSCGCKCEICRASVTKGNKVREMGGRYREYRPMSSEAHGHLLRLQQAMPQKEIAEKLGTNVSMIRWWAKQENPMVRPGIEKLLLSIPAPEGTVSVVGNRTRVDSIGSMRRLRALAVAGWDAKTLAPILGMHVSSVLEIRQGKQKKVTARTHEVIKKTADELCLKPRTRYGNAKRVPRNWKPLLAWDEDQIDKPLAKAEGAVEIRKNRHY